MLVTPLTFLSCHCNWKGFSKHFLNTTGFMLYYVVTYCNVSVLLAESRGKLCGASAKLKDVNCHLQVTSFSVMRQIA